MSNKEGKDVPTGIAVEGVDTESCKAVHTNRNFGLFSLIGLAFAVLNSWSAMGSSLGVSLGSGGPTAVIWGIIPAFLGNLATAASMAEICHVYPTSGGQYHWSALLAPPKYAPIISWVCGWFATAGWIALHAAAGALSGQLIVGALALNLGDSYVFQPWHLFLIYIGNTLFGAAVNIFGRRGLPAFNLVAFGWSVLGCVIVIVTCLACSSGHFASPKVVFTQFLNETGWPDGVAWIMGLLQASFGLIGADAVTHMVEEMPQPRKNAPRVMIAAVCIGAFTSFIFLVCILFCVKDLPGLVTDPSGPLLGAFYQATGSRVGALCLQVIPIACMFFTGTALCTTSSRMIYAFARDHGLPFSKFIAVLGPNDVPIRSVLLSTVFVIIFGCIYLGSSVALNAIMSSIVVSLNISYCIPIALVLIRGRAILRPAGLPEPTFTLGPILGPIANIFGLGFTAMSTVFFLFPPVIPATAVGMNYAIAVFGIVAIISIITWFTSGRRDFVGPRDLNILLDSAMMEPPVEKGRVFATSESAA